MSTVQIVELTFKSNDERREVPGHVVAVLGATKTGKGTTVTFLTESGTKRG
jgi:hypothetical protein